MKKLFILLVAALISGCATVGNLAIQDKTKVEQIKVGATTKGQVQELIGPPTVVNFGTEGLETWTYLVTTAKLNPAAMVPVVGLFANRHETESTSLVLMFSDSGVVKKMAYTEPSRPKEAAPENNSPEPLQ